MKKGPDVKTLSLGNSPWATRGNAAARTREGAVWVPRNPGGARARPGLRVAQAHGPSGPPPAAASAPIRPAVHRGAAGTREIWASPTYPDGVTRTIRSQPRKSDRGEERYLTPVFGVQALCL